jgi:sulfate/thiosulfate transport system substrate-binding protein
MIRRIPVVLMMVYLLAAAGWILRAGCVTRSYQQNPGQIPTLLNVAYDPTRELWAKINIAFQNSYESRHGIRPKIQQSHGGSASQARNVIEGQQADVVSLALWTDIDAIRKAQRIQNGWENRFPNRSLPYTSTIVFVVRKGNPKQIKDWLDLGRENVKIVTPNPKTSGNGKWSFLAIWGSYLRLTNNDEAAARLFVSKLFRRAQLDQNARDSTVTFSQKRIGDVHLTWENEAHLEMREAEGELEIVYPSMSILAEPHVAIVDQVVEKKGTREIAEAYLNFLYTKEAQIIIAEQYHRPINEAVQKQFADRFPAIPLFEAKELGTWESLLQKFFAEGAMFDQIQAEGAGR